MRKLLRTTRAARAHRAPCLAQRPVCSLLRTTRGNVGPPFGCRVCMRLAYETQRESALDRTRRRAMRLQHVLDGNGGTPARVRLSCKYLGVRSQVFLPFAVNYYSLFLERA